MSPAARPTSLTGPRPLQLVDGNLPLASPSSCPSPTVASLSTPPPTARSFKQRRQSSISYYPSDHTPKWDLRSPTASTRPSLQRSKSLGQNGAQDEKKGNRRSTGSIESPAAERAPLTLTEKHADLLQFIAQKESKCLELRAQLATHEAELVQLKRKWERIVSRGMDRAYAPTTPSTPGQANGVVLEGIREGVGRLLAAGLDISTPSSPVPMQALPGFAPVSRAAAVRRHSATQSMSSVSTRSSAQSSVRLSQSSASSLAFDEPPRELDEHDEAQADVSSPQEAKSSIELSPSALRSAKLHRRRSRDKPTVQASSPPVEAATSSPRAVSPPAFATVTNRQVKRSSLGASGLAPAASIPGLAAQPMASWMETVGSSVGRRWEELQKGETFTKNQKRASLLLSDMSQSLRTALVSTGPATGSPPPVSISSNPFAAAISPLAPSPQLSLLDDDDFGAVSALGGVLVPDSSPATAPSRPAPSPSTSVREVQSSADDDDWNW